VADRVLLHRVHEAVLPALQGAVHVDEDTECVGVIEGRTVAGTVEACDRAMKDAVVTLAGFREQPGLGGRAYFAVTGAQSDVEAAVEAGRGALGSRLHRTEVIPRPTAALISAVLTPGAFGVR
jgi:microcompartment protein CcmL/EutN